MPSCLRRRAVAGYSGTGLLRYAASKRGDEIPAPGVFAMAAFDADVFETTPSLVFVTGCDDVITDFSDSVCTGDATDLGDIVRVAVSGRVSLRAIWLRIGVSASVNALNEGADGISRIWRICGGVLFGLFFKCRKNAIANTMCSPMDTAKAKRIGSARDAEIVVTMATSPFIVAIRN